MGKKVLQVLTGKRFGKWLAGEQRMIGDVSHHRCTCECCQERLVLSQSLVRGDSKSCGSKACKVLPKPRPESDLRRTFQIYLDQSKVKKRTFGLTFESFKSLVLSSCWYCGEAPQIRHRKKEHSKRTMDPIPHNGIDRIDSDLGYEPGNCLPCCRPCNVAKSNMSQSEFLDKIHMIAKLHPMT